MSKKQRPSDSDALRKTILAGLLLGGATAVTASGIRTARLNKKLDDASDSTVKHDKDTVVVTVPKQKLKGIGKAASVPEVYKLTALAGAGVISYAALTALYRKLEDNRMKEVESKAYNKVINQLVAKNAKSEKSAQFLSTAIDNIDPARNVLALLALIGAAAWTKKRLDRGNVDSDKLKIVRPEKILFEAPESKKASSDAEKDASSSSNEKNRPAVTGKGVNDATRDSITTIRRILHDNPEAEELMSRNMLESSGWGKLNLLQNVPLVGKLMRMIMLRQLGLGTFYSPGWDKKRNEGLFRRKKLPNGINPNERAEQDLGRVRREILNNKSLRESIINMVADKKKLNGFARAYLRHNPDKLLDRMGISPMAARAATPYNDTDSKNSIAKSYFA